VQNIIRLQPFIADSIPPKWWKVYVFVLKLNLGYDNSDAVSNPAARNAY